MNEKKTFEDVVREGVEKMKNVDKKETIFDKAKKVMVSDYAKNLYGAIAMGVVQGAIARFTFDTLGKLDDSTLIEIED